MKLVLTPVGASLEIGAVDAEGRHVYGCTKRHWDLSRLAAAAEVVGLTPDVLLGLVRGTGAGSDPVEFNVVGGVASKVETAEAVEVVAPFRVTVASRISTGRKKFDGATPVDVFAEALAYRGEMSEPIIRWADTEKLAAADFDAPCEGYPDFNFECLYPRPEWAWMTHGRGLRLIYADDPATGLRADEVAALGALAVLRRDPTYRVEIKHDTRHPAYPRGGQVAGAVHRLGQHCTTEAAFLWTSKADVSPDQVEGWLDERGMEVGGRYPHDRCVIDPRPTSGDTPVVALDTGIWCHVCEGRGRGFRSYASLIGEPVEGYLGRMVRHLTHWTHAKHVVRACYPDLREDVARLVYSAALKLHHGTDDARVEEVFAPIDFVRFEGYWATEKGEPWAKNVPDAVRRLPCMLLPDGGIPKLPPFNHGAFCNSHDLGDHGYPGLFPVWGHRIYGHHIPYPDTYLPIVVPNSTLRDSLLAPYRPRYVPAEGRDVEGAWEKLEGLFPGLNTIQTTDRKRLRDVVELLIVARGCTETGRGAIPPHVLFTGTTGSGKTVLAMLAAAIVGDSAGEVVWNADETRLRQAIFNAAATGTFCICDELLKKGTKHGFTAKETFDVVLTLTPGSTSHLMYVGPVKLGRPPVFVWTDTELPDEIALDPQHGRRVFHVGLSKSLGWDRSTADQGLGSIKELRIHDRGEYAPACDAIMSEVIDRHFRGPADFKALAEGLGFLPLAVARQEQRRELFRAFYDAVQSEPLYTGKKEKLQGCRGFHVEGNTPAGVASAAIAERPEDRVRDLNAFSWEAVVPGASQVIFFSAKEGRTLFVRWDVVS